MQYKLAAFFFFAFFLRRKIKNSICYFPRDKVGKSIHYVSVKDYIIGNFKPVPIKRIVIGLNYELSLSNIP